MTHTHTHRKHVPQGSILGPLLFLLYVNDITTNIGSATRLFADDCTLYRSVTRREDCILLQDDLTRIYSWSQTWQLSLNISKCKVLCISNKRKPPSFIYTMNNSPLESVDKFKYLGVYIDNHLKWNDHISFVSHKATRILNLLRRSLYRCKRTAKNKAFKALVRPHLEYAAPVWSPHTTTGKAALEKVQKRAAHWICSKWNRNLYRWSKTYNQARSELKWPTLAQRHTILSCCQTYKILNSMDCINFSNYFKQSATNTRHHPLTLFCEQSRIDSYRYSYFINAPYLWNSLPADIVTLSSLQSFRSNLSAYLLEY